MLMRSMMISLAAAGLVLMLASPASAVIIFEDDFNRSNNNSVGNGWSEIEDENNDVAIVNNRLQLRDFKSGSDNGQDIVDAAASQLGGLDSTGLTNITLMYDWRASGNTESSDTLWVQWKLISDALWTNLVVQALGGSGFASNSVGLGIGAAGVSNLQIRFATDVSSATEAAFIDNVKLTGDGRIAAVPEPSSLALFGFGLVGLAAVRRRRRTKTC